MVGNGPPALWAMLQSEDGWLTKVREDIAQLRAKDEDWPEDTLTAWQTWTHKVRERPGFYKHKVKRFLQQAHRDYVKVHWARAGLWVLYRDLRATAPRTELPMTQWACRACRRGFRSKKQLGVYHFKSHGRVATYRECIEGTECRSCGRQFWTTARLSTHLRDSQACVSGLRGRGMTAETIAPGIGSRKWRQTAVEQYNPTGQRGHDYCGGGDQKHRSQMRLQGASPRQIVLDAFTRFPLYYEEETDVLQTVREELEMMCGDEELRPWDKHTAAEVLDGLQFTVPQVDARDHEDADTHSKPLHAIGDVLDNFNWREAIELSWQPHGTPPQATARLGDDWEAGDETPSGACCAPAVTLHSKLVPARIREVWQRIVNGQVGVVEAPDTFWASPYAVAFLPLRASASN
eukprot:s3300_g6.t1